MICNNNRKKACLGRFKAWDNSAAVGKFIDIKPGMNSAASFLPIKQGNGAAGEQQPDDLYSARSLLCITIFSTLVIVFKVQLVL
jgi:hypothetical protein